MTPELIPEDVKILIYESFIEGFRGLNLGVKVMSSVWNMQRRKDKQTDPLMKVITTELIGWTLYLEKIYLGLP